MSNDHDSEGAGEQASAWLRFDWRRRRQVPGGRMNGQLKPEARAKVRSERSDMIAPECKGAMPTALGGHASTGCSPESMPTQSGGHGTLAILDGYGRWTSWSLVSPPRSSRPVKAEPPPRSCTTSAAVVRSARSSMFNSENVLISLREMIGRARQTASLAAPPRRSSRGAR